MNVRHDAAIAFERVAPEPGMAVPVDVFLRWLDGQDAKFEYDRGTIGMMVRVTQGHAVLGSRIMMAFGSRLDLDRYDVVAEAFAVHVGASVRFPDVLVQRAGLDRDALESAEPIVIVEVLSPSSVYLDTLVKRDEYLALPTLQAYVIARQDEPRLTVWARPADGAFPADPVEIEGPDSVLALDGLGVSIPLGELYRGVR